MKFGVLFELNLPFDGPLYFFRRDLLSFLYQSMCDHYRTPLMEEIEHPIVDVSTLHAKFIDLYFCHFCNDLWSV